MLHSLNISVACAVTLYEAFRQKTAAGHYAKQKLAAPELEQLKNEWKFSNDTNV
jgi:tRNA (guanosine-2'-O-)-methyltransferase